MPLVSRKDKGNLFTEEDVYVLAGGRVELNGTDNTHRGPRERSGFPYGRGHWSRRIKVLHVFSVSLHNGKN